MSWTMVLFIRDSGIKKAYEREEEPKFGKMEASMLVTGRTIKQIAKED